MIKLKLKRTDGVNKEVNIHEDLSEFPLNNKVAFEVAREEMAAFVEKEEYESNPNFYLMLMAEAVAGAIDLDVKELLPVSVKDVLTDGVIDPVKLNKAVEDIDIDSLDGTLSELYNWYDHLIRGYEFIFKGSDDYCFTHKGVDYEIPHVIRETYQRKQFSDYNVIQAVETWQIQRMMGNFNLELDRKRDSRFTGYLNIIAINCRKPGEEIPLDDIEFQTWVDDKVVECQDIDTKTAMDVGFFLLTT